jgi:hypothetical protein
MQKEINANIIPIQDIKTNYTAQCAKQKLLVSQGKCQLQ